MHLQAPPDVVDPALAEPFPPAVDLLPVVAYLATEGFDDQTIFGVCYHVKLHGTAQCLRGLTDKQRDRIEALLPGNPDSWGPETDADVWMTN